MSYLKIIFIETLLNNNHEGKDILIRIYFQKSHTEDY